MNFFCAIYAVKFLYFVCCFIEGKKSINMQWGELLNPSSQSGKTAELSNSETAAQKLVRLWFPYVKFIIKAWNK